MMGTKTVLTVLEHCWHEVAAAAVSHELSERKSRTIYYKRLDDERCPPCCREAARTSPASQRRAGEASAASALMKVLGFAVI